MNLNSTIGLSQFNISSSCLACVELPLLFIIGLISIAGNLFNIIVIYQTPSLRSLKNTFLTSLTITDALTGIIALPLIIIVNITGNRGILCQIQGFFITLFNGSSLALTLAISADRCHAVVNPYRHMKYATIRKYMIITISLFLLPLTIAILPLLQMENFGLGHYEFITICWISLYVDSTNIIIASILAVTIFAAILMIAICYFILFIIAYHKIRRPEIGTGSLKTSLRTVTLIVGTKVLCWIPITTFLCLSLLQYWLKVHRNMISNDAMVVAYILSYCNVATNPLIYLATNAILREKFYSKIGCIKLDWPIAPNQSNPVTRSSTMIQLHQHIYTH